MLLTLSARETFSGGGTGFWSTASTEGPEIDGCSLKMDGPPSFVLAPPIGTALIFGGDVTHAARVITSGERAVFVASFSPDSLAGGAGRGGTARRVAEQLARSILL